jgi:hypothetical protein
VFAYKLDGFWSNAACVVIQAIGVDSQAIRSKLWQIQLVGEDPKLEPLQLVQVVGTLSRSAINETQLANQIFGVDPINQMTKRLRVIIGQLHDLRLALLEAALESTLEERNAVAQQILIQEP